MASPEPYVVLVDGVRRARRAMPGRGCSPGPSGTSARGYSEAVRMCQNFAGAAGEAVRGSVHVRFGRAAPARPVLLGRELPEVEVPLLLGVRVPAELEGVRHEPVPEP